MKKYVVMLIFSALIMFGVMGAMQYYIIKDGTVKELLAKAERDLKESKRVDAVKAEVESAVRNLLSNVQKSINQPDNFYAISSQMVKNNMHIVGAGIAFKPNFYKSSGKQRLYAPYAYDEQPDIRVKKRKTSNPQIRRELLGFDYTNREWYQEPMKTGQSLWTEPYVDQGGSFIIMSTYVVPVRDKDNSIVGVFFADVPMEDVSLLAMDMNSEFSRGGMIFLYIQIALMLLFCFVIYLAVKASKRYKEKMVDAEKEELLAVIQKLKETNRRLTERNMELGDKLSSLTR